MAASNQRVAQLPLQTAFTYDPKCNTQQGILAAFNLYVKNPSVENPVKDVLASIPWEIDLRASVSVKDVNGVSSAKGRFLILSTLYPNNLQESIVEWQSKNTKTMSLRQFPLSFLTVVFDRLRKHVLFVVPAVMINPEVCSPKGDDTVSVKKGSADNTKIHWSKFHVLPPKVAAQAFVSLYIHNNPAEPVKDSPEEEPKNSLRASPLFNDFKTAWQSSDNNSRSTKDIKSVTLCKGVEFPKFPSIFINHEMFKEVSVRASDYINKPGEVTKKPAAEATKKRTKRSSGSSDEEDLAVSEEAVSEHDTLAYIDTNDSFEATPSTRKNPPAKTSKASPMKTSVVTKQAQKVPPPRKPLKDDNTDNDSESSSSSRPSKKRQATAAKKSSEPVGEKRASASLLAGSLTVNGVTQKILDASFEGVSTTYPSQEASSESSTEVASDALKMIQSYAKMPETDNAADTFVKKFGDEFKEVMQKTLHVFDAFKSDDAVRQALAASIIEQLPEISQASLKATNPEWVDNEGFVADGNSRIVDIKTRLGIPEGVHLPLGVYSTLFGLLKNSDDVLAGHSKDGSAMMARPKNQKAQTLFVPMTSSQVPAGTGNMEYSFMLFQGAENADRLVSGMIDCFKGTTDGFAVTLESSLSVVEDLEKKTREALNSSRRRNIKTAKHALLLLKTAESEKKAIAQELEQTKASSTTLEREKDLEIESLKAQIASLEKKLKAKAAVPISSSSPVKPPPKEITLVAKKSNNYKPPIPLKPLELEDDPIDDFSDAVDESKDAFSPASPPPHSSQKNKKKSLDVSDEIIDDLVDDNQQTAVEKTPVNNWGADDF